MARDRAPVWRDKWYVRSSECRRRKVCRAISRMPRLATLAKTALRSSAHSEAPMRAMPSGEQSREEGRNQVGKKDSGQVSGDERGPVFLHLLRCHWVLTAEKHSAGRRKDGNQGAIDDVVRRGQHVDGILEEIWHLHI